MSPEMLQVIMVVFTVWGLAVAFKAYTALSKHEAYTFSFWDGGLARSGRRLNPMGTKIKLAAGLLITGWCVITLARIYVGQTGYFIFLGLVALSIISDFANSET